MTVGLKATVAIGDASEFGFLRQSDGLHIALIVLMTAPLALRRVYTIPIFFVILGSWIVDRGLDYPDSLAGIGVGIAFYTIGAVLEYRRSLLIGGASAAAVVAWTGIGAAVLESVTSTALITTLIATVTPLLLGREVHERRRRVEELQERAERAEREREQQAKQAVAEERTRIARELHDVVAHQMTVMTVQAEGAKRIAIGADPRLIEALETIRLAGHSALAEMRRTVGLLRASDEDAATEPLPRLTDLDRLVERVRAAGLPVELDVSGTAPVLSDGAELSAYRIVQESLTNAFRHGGPGVTATVSIQYADDRVEVAISDDGRGSSSNTSNGGHGIVGMRERIAVLGGVFEAGPRPGGGFIVRATIPAES